MSRRLRIVAAAAVLALSGALIPTPALAAPVAAVADPDPGFYTPPPSLPDGGHGTVVRQERFTPKLGVDQPAVSAWRMLYTSTDARGAQTISSGSVIVPSFPWLRGGPRPVLNYAPGSHGEGASCAPSIQMANGTEYEAANVVAALKQGYAVVMTDYQGYTAGSKSLYLVGAAAAHDVLDAQTAALQIPSTGISADAPTALWGYSQGSQAVAVAAQVHGTYAPAIKLVGMATGGVPADLLESATYLESKVGAGDVALAISGLYNQYPEIDLPSLVNEKGSAALAELHGKCVFPAILDYQNTKIADYTKTGQSLAELAATPVIAKAIADQKVDGSAISVPVYQFHGQADEFVPISVGYALARQYCAAGVADQFTVYPSEHLATQFQAFGPALAWIGDRFAGKAAPTSCGYSGPDPVSTANPGGGDFRVSLAKWPLGGTLHLNKLNGTITLPSNGTFTGAADLTTNQLQDGVVDIPPFTTTLLASGLVPLETTVGLEQAGTAGGAATLDANGTLGIDASVRLTIHLQKVDFLGVGLTDSRCSTTAPVTFPLSYSGPLSSLGNGKLTFTGKATLPPLTGCGALTDVLNTLFPGPDNTFSFTVKPPAPVVL